MFFSNIFSLTNISKFLYGNVFLFFIYIFSFSCIFFKTIVISNDISVFFKYIFFYQVFSNTFPIILKNIFNFSGFNNCIKFFNKFLRIFSSFMIFFSFLIYFQTEFSIISINLNKLLHLKINLCENLKTY